MENIRVTFIQSYLHWEDKVTNLLQFEQKLAPLADQTDLIVLPEMFSTGFSMNAGALAEDMEGRTMQWIAEQANKCNAAITGSFIVQEAGNFYNRLVWMRPDGSHEIYDKRHLFTYAEEHHHYTAGSKHLLVELKGWKVLPLICYDLRFPVWSRNVQDYDLLIYVANFPERRSHAWKSLLIARAIENLSYTIGVNRVGEDGNHINHAGDSAIINYAGETLYQVRHLEDIFTTTLSWQAQQDFRQRFAFLIDRDDFLISNR